MEMKILMRRNSITNHYVGGIGQSGREVSFLNKLDVHNSWTDDWPYSASWSLFYDSWIWGMWKK